MLLSALAAPSLMLPFAVIAVLLQEMFIFAPIRGETGNPLDGRGWAYEDVRADVDGCVTTGYYIPVENPRGAVLFSHGNGCTMGSWGAAGPFRELGFSFLIYDYGGFGLSTGRVSEKRCCDDIRAMWRFLTETKGFTPERIVLMGISLGGGPTVDLAAEYTPGAVILDSTYLSIPQVARDTFKLGFLDPFILTRFESFRKMHRVTCPVFVTHSVEDDLIPFAHGQELYRLAPGPKRFLEARGRHPQGHGLVQEAWVEVVKEFIVPLFPLEGEAPTVKES